MKANNIFDYHKRQGSPQRYLNSKFFNCKNFEVGLQELEDKKIFASRKLQNL